MRNEIHIAKKMFMKNTPDLLKSLLTKRQVLLDLEGEENEEWNFLDSNIGKESGLINKYHKNIIIFNTYRN